MIDIELIMRIIIKKGEVTDFEDKVKGSIKVEKPESYKELVNQIQKGFNISSNDLVIIGIDDEDDEYNIKDEDTYDENKGSCIKYRIILEIHSGAKSEPIQVENVTNDTNGTNNINIINEANKYVDVEFDLESNLLNDEKELKDLLDKTMKNLEPKNPSIEIDELLFNDLNEKQSGDNNELYNYFLSNLNEKISEKNEAQKKSFLETITKEFLSVEEGINDKVEEIKSNTKNYFEDSNDVLVNLNEMKKNIPLILDPNKILKQDPKPKKDQEPKGGSKPKSDLKPKSEPDQKPKPEQKPKSVSNPEPKKEPEPGPAPNPEPVKIEPEKIEIITDKKEYEFKKGDVKGFISINIKIKNISGRKIDLKDKKIFIKDNSAKESEVKTDLNINEEMDNNIEKDIEVKIPITPPIQDSYNYELYIKNNKEEIISDKPLSFKITIITEKEPRKPDGQLSKEEEDEIYNKLDEEFVVSNFMDEAELRAKIQEFRGDMEQLKKYVEDSI